MFQPVALIHVNTLLVLIDDFPLRAGTSERSQRVLARAAQTKTRNGLALIDVHAPTGVDVLEEAKVAIGLMVTLLTWVTPGHADGGTAKLPGANHAF